MGFFNGTNERESFSHQPAAASKPAVEPVVGSEATLWAPFGER